MSYQITLQPSGHTFAANPDETLLDAALRQGMLVPYGCRNGACGACKGTVVSGTVEAGKTPLTEADRAAGQILFCSTRATSDLVVHCAEARANTDIPIKTLPARVEKMQKLAPDVMVLWLRLPATERLQFLAGQYIDILLKDGKRRSFSLANAPENDGLLELHIREVPGGLFTGQVFSTMKERDILRFNGPHGTFYLREDSPKPIVMIAGGTGFAPVKALVEHALKENVQRPIAIYWGARDRAGLYQHELPHRWASEHAHVSYVPVLSEPAADDHWQGRTGFVHQAVLADFPDLSGHQVYVCGSPVMVEAVRRDLCGQAGLPAEELFADAFSFNT